MPRDKFVMPSLLLIFCLAIFPFTSSSEEVSWERAVEFFENGEFSRAKDEFSRWVEESKKENVHSPQAYRNLAIIHWLEEEPVEALYYLLNDLELRVYPLEVWSSLNLLGKLEQSQASLIEASGQIPFKLQYFLNQNVRDLCTSLCIWLLLFALLVPRIKQPWVVANHRWLRQASFVGSALMVSLVLVGYLSKKMVGNIGVVSDELGVVEVTETKDSTESISELPSGSIVYWTKEEDGYVELHFPYSGWIEKDSILEPVRLG